MVHIFKEIRTGFFSKRPSHLSKSKVKPQRLQVTHMFLFLKLINDYIQENEEEKR